MAFVTSVIPSAARDAEALASWNIGDDVRKVVLPLSVSAAWAYADQPTFDLIMHRRGLSAASGGQSQLIEVSNDAMFVCPKAYVQPVGSGAIVAFRGTEPTSLINWLADATLHKVAFHASPPGAPRGYVHGGFYRNTRAIWPSVVTRLAELNPQWIYITGHSFGGALAVLAAALLRDYHVDARNRGFEQLWPRLRGVFTFGQPMVGDAAFKEHYEDSVGRRLIRFVYANDIVPHLPPDTAGWRPVHLGAEYRGNDEHAWQLRDDSHVVGNGIAANLQAVAAWIKEQSGVLPRVPLKYSWGDHAPNNYVRISLPNGADSGSEFD